MIKFPNCKINLGLHITGKRKDGYHDLETVFYPVNYRDILEVISQPANGTQPASAINISFSGLTINGNLEDNLCIKAYYLLKKDYPQLPPVAVHLHKQILMGAGLGGGSSDGAFMLKLLNEKFDLNLSTAELINYALELGSDCPFFIINRPCFAAGRGEILKEIDLDLSGYNFVLVNPGIHINTGWAFSQLDPLFPGKSIAEIIRQPIETWKELLVNDFEEAVAKEYPAIPGIKKKLYESGAVYASMSGSGSSVYGIFKIKPLHLLFPEQYMIMYV